jgi:hypothetical protein
MKAIHLNEISEVRIHKVSAEAVSSAVVISLSGAKILLVRHLPDYWPTEPWHVAALSGGTRFCRSFMSACTRSP